MEKIGSPKLKIAIIHPYLGIGGAERLIVDAAVELAFHGHKVHVFTAHHDKNHCFEETVAGPFPVTVYGGFLPRHIFYHFQAVCAYLRCMFVELCPFHVAHIRHYIGRPSFCCYSPDENKKVNEDLLLALHTTALLRTYRKPVDMIEEEWRI